MDQFEEEIRAVINRHAKENGSGTPDFVLAEYLRNCLAAWNAGISARESWYGREMDRFGMPVKNG